MKEQKDMYIGLNGQKYLQRPNEHTRKIHKEEEEASTKFDIV